MATQIAAVKWFDCVDLERPSQGELVLTIDKNDEYAFMFWRDDACAWDDPVYGWATDIIAWARPPLYVKATVD